MPELPEVETVRRSLVPFLEGRQITRFRAPWPRAVSDMSPARFLALLRGRRIVRVERRAKFLVIVLDQGRFTIHLRMTGKLYPAPQAPRDTTHVSGLFFLDDGQVLVFHDVRRFGRIEWLGEPDDWQTFSARFGPEPLERIFSADWLYDGLRQRNRQLKALLLDQSFVAGLGNIYVDEALWEARLHPQKLSSTVNRAQAQRLHHAIQTVLKESIRANGTTFLDFKFLGGESGGYTDSLRVFARGGQRCGRCGTTIQKLRVSQRGTHICPKCQKIPAARRKPEQ